MNIVPQYLANVFYLPSSERSKKLYKPQVITEGRTITDKEHQSLYKEKEKEGRKEVRKKKQETKLIEEENKKLKQLAEKKGKGSTKKSRRKQSPQKRPQKFLTKSEKTDV